MKLLLRSLKFDEEHTARGILHLEKYAYKLISDKGVDRSKPDQSSPHADAADALRMMAVSQSVWSVNTRIASGQPRRYFSEIM